MSKTILVTGSRYWGEKGVSPYADRLVMGKYLDKFIAKGGTKLIHGDCPTGADKIASSFFCMRGLETEAFPPDPELGKRGFYVRNQAMVDTKPDLVLAFVLGESRGTSMTIELAQKAGLSIGVVYSAGTLMDGSKFSRDWAK